MPTTLVVDCAANRGLSPWDRSELFRIALKPLAICRRSISSVRLTTPRGSGVPNEISADARDDEDEGEHDDAWDRAASHALASA